MPELPEVEALATFLRAEAVGRAVTKINVVAINSLKTFRPPIDALVGRTLTGVDRHGKFLDLIFGVDPASVDATGADVAGDQELHLVFHLARAGWLRWSTGLSLKPPKPGRGPLALRVHLGPPGEPGVANPGPSDLTGVGFDLTEAGTQKRLAAYLVTSPAEVPGIQRLGPDPLRPEFTVETLRDILDSAGGKQIKGVLTDQERIAGIGNAYSDEILHAAKLSPFKPANGLDEPELAALYQAIGEIERDALRRSEGLAAADLKSEKRSGMAVHGRTGQPCPVCGDTVREVSYADKSFQYCPGCQTGGKILADRRLSKLLK